MEENRKSSTKILVAILVLMAFSLIAVEYKNSTSIEKLKADNAALRYELLNKDSQLKSERAKTDDPNSNFAEDSATSDTIETIAAPQQIKYRYKRHYKYRYKRHYKYRYKRHYRTNRKHWARRRYSVSRGSSRANVEPVIREVGAAYWPDPAELDALVWICAHECTTPGVVNPRGFYGLFQLHSPPSWMILGDAASETKAGCEYIRRRYGSPLAAKAWWVRHRWY